MCKCLANLSFTLLEDLDYYDVYLDRIKSLYNNDVSGATTLHLVRHGCKCNELRAAASTCLMVCLAKNEYFKFFPLKN
jgi:hypothetical protein